MSSALESSPPATPKSPPAVGRTQTYRIRRLIDHISGTGCICISLASALTTCPRRPRSCSTMLSTIILFCATYTKHNCEEWRTTVAERGWSSALTPCRHTDVLLLASSRVWPILSSSSSSTLTSTRRTHDQRGHARILVGERCVDEDGSFQRYPASPHAGAHAHHDHPSFLPLLLPHSYPSVSIVHIISQGAPTSRRATRTPKRAVSECSTVLASSVPPALCTTLVGSPVHSRRTSYIWLPAQV